MSSINLKISLDTLQQKARERTVKTQSIEYDLFTLVERIKKRSIQLDPEYQRRHRWSDITSSRLIESLILNIPIPVIFISQDVDVDDEVTDNISRFTVIDGQQRLTAIHDFLEGHLMLEGLETLTELNGSKYADLPPFLRRRLEERTVSCLRIDSTVDAQVKFDIFERLNTGSVKLEAQELRNATARGPFNDLIKELARFRPFRRLLQVDEKDPDSNNKVKKMEDAELVLRFFALRGGRYRTLRKGFKEFLTSAQVEFNKLSNVKLEEFRTDFKTYMEFIHDNIGATAFSKWRDDTTTKRKMSNFNAAVFDAVAVGIANVFSANEIRERPKFVADKIKGYEELFADNIFFLSVSGSVNDAAKVATRIDMMGDFLKR
jgi:hypothetical protein